MTQNPNAPLSERLADTRIGIRSELEYSRHCFGNDVHYVARDPITFESHKLRVAEYQILIRLHDRKPLNEIFEECVAAGVIELRRKEEFYEFVFSLHKLGFLNLPMSDAQTIYRRFLSKRSQKRKSYLMAPFFLQVPLFNPDRILSETAHIGCKMFTKSFFALWLVVVALAGFLAFQHRALFVDQMDSFMDPRSIALIWVVLVALKIVHESGHAYATKHFGGHVPSTGVYLIALTPCAYVDASASWSFSKKSQRIIVGLGGMYIEIFVAAIAMILWCALPPGPIQDILHKVVTLASVVTIGFNINPLMKFDGYYILSDILEIPNMRQKATEELQSVIKAVFLRIPSKSVQPRGRRIFLATFGICMTIYRIGVVLSISTMIAMKYFFVGLFLGLIYIGMEIFKTGGKLIRFFLHSPETEGIGKPALALLAIILAAITTAIAQIPLPGNVYASASLHKENEQLVRAEVSGFLNSLQAKNGSPVHFGEQLAELNNIDLITSLEEASANYKSAKRVYTAYLTDDPAQAKQSKEELMVLERELDKVAKKCEQLQIEGGLAGSILRSPFQNRIGSYVEAGEEIALIGSGGWQIEFYLTEHEHSEASPSLGKIIEFRPRSNPELVMSGKIIKIMPAGDRQITAVELTQLAGGNIVVNSDTLEAHKAYFKIVVALDHMDKELFHGMTGTIRFQGEQIKMGKAMWRSVLRFLRRLRAE